MTVTILTSGVGLGIYVPALLNQRDLRAAGQSAEVEVLEGFYTPAQQTKHLAHRDAFRQDFKLALIANRMPQQAQLDGTRIEALLGRWRDQKRERFLVWSGFWLPILERYGACSVDLCRIDAIPSASFRRQPRPPDARDIWLWNGDAHRLEWQIRVTDQEPLPFAVRERLVVHGGGWAIGTFERVLPEMRGWPIDLLGPQAAGADRHFTPDPGWQPWQRTHGELTFPPLAEKRGDDMRWLPNHTFPPAHSLVREACAIVSKPGGGTLIDSLSAATPVVLLEPYGEAEARSGALWEELGFGIRFERWRELGFDRRVLARLHDNLLAARERPRRYPELA